jgi:origin recognition complex subunit 4
VNSVLLELLHEKSFTTNTIIIALNGLIHTDDRHALKSITTQMNLDKQVEGKVFNSFSENLTFLLSCLKTGELEIFGSTSKFPHCLVFQVATLNA